MKTGFLFTMAVFILCIFSCTNRDRDMSMDEKVQDFEFLYQTLKENYPFFGVAQRQHETNWLGKKYEYMERIKLTSNDSAYLFTLLSIIGELDAGHLSIGPTTAHEHYIDLYKYGTTEKPRYRKWLDVLLNKNERSKHWQQIREKRWDKYIEQDYTPPKNYADSLLVDDSIAVMRFNNAFFYSNFIKDTALINSFLGEIKDFRYLIIDIQDNMGGSANSWKRHIAGKIIASPVVFPRFQVVKDGALNRYFHPESFEEGSIVHKNDSLPNIPDEILDGTFYLSSSTDTIIPNNPIPFSGKIFLLVNEMVASASEDFAYFCKVSKWATVAGCRTLGDGNCGEPILFILPKSGITLNHPSVAGLNIDGSLNFETRTVPDLPVEGKNRDERLNNLIEIIRNNPPMYGRDLSRPIPSRW